MIPAVRLVHLGRMPYVKALAIQEKLCETLREDVKFGYKKHNSKGNTLLLVEHEPVYTIGIRSRQYDEKYVTQLRQRLADHKKRADFVETNRGGLITFHGPGQLVAYPILDLNQFRDSIPNRSLKCYVQTLERVIIDSLASVGLPGAHTVREYPGVWLNNSERKIAFIGISCKRYVTMHGISINCDCDLSWFEHIVSCGIENKQITSVSQELKARSNDDGGLIEGDSSINHVARAFCASFSERFSCRMVNSEINPLDELAGSNSRWDEIHNKG